MQAFHRRHGSAAEPELAVVVIFDQHGAARACPAQQIEPALQGECRPEHELMRRGEIHRFWPSAQPSPCGGIQSFIIHAHRHDARSRVAERIRRTAVAGIFDPHGIARLHQDARQQVECLLRAGDDDDLIRGAGDTA